MAAGTAEKPKTDKPSAAELKAAKQERDAAEKEKAAASNGRAAIDSAHKALGTGPGVVPNLDHGPQQIHDGDPDEVGTDAPVQMSFAVGGKKPTEALLTVTGKIEIPGCFAKGSTVVLRVEVDVDDVRFRDQKDSVTRQVIGCKRLQSASVGDVSVLDA